MSPQSLPAEVEDIILDHLYNDRQTLASCALVHRSWLPTSRHHLWRELRLKCKPKQLDRIRAVQHAAALSAQVEISRKSRSSLRTVHRSRDEMRLIESFNDKIREGGMSTVRRVIHDGIGMIPSRAHY